MGEGFTLEKLSAAMRQIGQIAPLAPPIRLVESVLMTIGPFEDWTGVRSHGRAARRRRMGHKQRIRIYHLPSPKLLRFAEGTIVGHPVTIDHLRRTLVS